MKLAALIFAACTGMLTSLGLMIVLLSTLGVKSSTTYSPVSDHSRFMITLGDGHACRKGDWVVCMRAGSVGTIKAVVGDMAFCENHFEIRPAAFGSVFRIF